MRFVFLLFFFLSQVTYASYIFSASGGGGSWGSITGTLSDQTDLNTALGLKAPADSPTFTTKTTHSYATASRVPYFNSSKELVASAVTDTVLGYVDFTSSGQTQLDSRAPIASPTFTGVVTVQDGATGAPSLTNAGDSNTGIYFPSDDQLAITVGGTTQITYGTVASGIATISAAPSYVFEYRYSGGAVQGVRFNNSSSTSSYFELTSGTGVSPAGWGILTSGIAGFQNKWKFQRTDGAYTALWLAEQGQVYIGGSTVGQKGTTLTVQAQPNITNVGGTTTANATTSISGSSTSFLERIGIGDQISVSSAASTYATVTAISSATALTVDSALGDGTSQTINVKRAIQRWDKSDGTPVGLVNTDGRWSIGETGVTNVTHRLTTALGTNDDDILTLTNGPDGKAGNPAVYIKLNVNGTDRYIPAW